MCVINGLTALISGANKGIGKAISLKLAQNGYKIGVIGKTTGKSDQNSVEATCELIEKNGGHGIPLPADIAKDEQIESAVDCFTKKFKNINILINNAGFIKFGKDANFLTKDFDYMHRINTRAPYILSKLCLPHMEQNRSVIINISPCIKIGSENFSNKIAYTITKYLTSLLTIGLSTELKNSGICVNSLWPKYAIFTQSMERNAGAKSQDFCRKPEIMADACLALIENCLNSLSVKSKDGGSNIFTGNFCIDEDILKTLKGQSDFSKYAYNIDMAKAGKLIKVPYND